MLFNGERVGDGTGPGVRRRRRPDRRHHADRLGHGQRDRPCSRSSPRGSMYDPSAVFYMEKLATGPRRPTSSTSGCPSPRTSAGSAKAKRESPADVTVVILDRPRHDAIVDEMRCDRRADQVHHRRRRRRRDHGGPRGHRHRPAARHRRHPRGHHRRLRHQDPRRRHPGPALADRRRRAAEGASTPATISTGSWSPTSWCAARTCSSSRPASPTASCSRASATAAAARRRTPHRDAVAQRHHPARRERAPARQAARLLRDRLRPRDLSQLASTTSRTVSTTTRGCSCWMKCPARSTRCTRPCDDSSAHRC